MTEKTQALELNLSQLFNLTANLLIASFQRQTAEQVETIYRELSQGNRVEAGHLKAQDNETSVAVYLELDHGEFVGQLTKQTFLSCVDILLQKFSSKAKEDSLITEHHTLTNSENGEIVFNIPAGIKMQGSLNVLMLSVLPAPDHLIVRLLFLNPNQFKEQIS